MATLGRQTPAQPGRVFGQDDSRHGLHLSSRRRVTGDGGQPEQVGEPL